MTKIVSKQEWIAALRSGEYTQGYSFLCRKTLKSTSFCCLGVYCDLKGYPISYVTSRNIVRFKANSGTQALKIIEGDFDFDISEEIINRLVNLNDSKVSFEKIANYIEKNI